MRRAGIIGGIAPESTIQYYRQIVDLYRARQPDGSYPPVVINSIDMTRMLELIGAGRLAEVTDDLLEEIGRLASAGADFAVLASNTPHVVFDALQARAPIPLRSIVAAACRAAAAAGLRRVGLLGTRFTMQGKLYPAVFGAAGIAVVAPEPDEQTFIHEAYLGELVHGNFRPETRARLEAIIGELKGREAIDGVVLGGTELPLILPEATYAGLPVLDTTRLHVEVIVDEILAD
jgi:aspartate racemase